ncbi:lipoyl(octanoyl) transferase LipB [Candidatus Neomarinimicrobiota bacterium]
MTNVSSDKQEIDTAAPISIYKRLDQSNLDDFAGLIKEHTRGPGLTVFFLGRQTYLPVWALQQKIHAWRVRGEISDVALLLEHEPVYTLGKNSNEAHLLDRRPPDADTIAIDRGGDVTYHGPGQLVGYPIIDLQEHRPSVSWYMRGLEEIIIRTLDSYGVSGSRMDGLPGVWVRRRKIAALGVRLARWSTMHGFALNVDVPRRYYDGIIPCGILEYGIANLNDFLVDKTEVMDVASRLAPIMRDYLRGRNGQVSWVREEPAA